MISAAYDPVGFNNLNFLLWVYYKFLSILVYSIFLNHAYELMKLSGVKDFLVFYIDFHVNFLYPVITCFD